MTVQESLPAARLRELCGGAVHLPGDPSYDMARTPWNLLVSDYPAAVTYPAFPDEVAEVLRAASSLGLQVAAQGTGHGAPPLAGRLTDAVLLRTSAMNELHVDPGRRIARVGAGVLWGDVARAAGAHGLAGLHPSSPGVGVAGYSIGGGIGWYARRLGLQVAAQGTGHGAPPLAGRLTDAVLLRTSAMNELHVDPGRRIARVGAGVLWGDVARAAGAHGLAGLHPSSPGVGVAGYSIGGGIGWYARRLGLQCNAVTAVEIVLADGTFVRATEDTEADLFWAVRGGGTPLGVVCALEFRLFPLETVVAGYLAWDAAAVEQVLPRWVEWCATAPDETTTAFRLLDVPDDQTMPGDVRGRRLVVVDGAVLGDDAAATAVLAPLRALAPEIDTVTRVPAASLVDLHLDPEGPTPAYASSTLVSELPDAAVAAILEAVGPDSGTALTVAELRQLGGALSRPAPGGGVLSALDGEFLALGLGLDPENGDWDRQRADAARFLAAVEPWASGRTYLPMLDDAVDTRKAFPPEVHARLSAIRRSVDPDGLFMPPHPSPEATPSAT